MAKNRTNRRKRKGKPTKAPANGRPSMVAPLRAQHEKRVAEDTAFATLLNNAWAVGIIQTLTEDYEWTAEECGVAMMAITKRVREVVGV